jgi:hypothetical protein
VVGVLAVPLLFLVLLLEVTLKYFANNWSAQKLLVLKPLVLLDFARFGPLARILVGEQL